MAQRIEALVSKPGDLKLIPETPMVQGKKAYSVSLDLYQYIGKYVPTHIYK